MTIAATDKHARSTDDAYQVPNGITSTERNHRSFLYSLVESAKLVGLNPDDYLRTPAETAIDGIEIPFPHELAAQA